MNIEKEIKSHIAAIFAKCGASMGMENSLRQENLVNLCLNDIQCHIELEKELNNTNINEYIVQTMIHFLPTNTKEGKI